MDYKEGLSTTEELVGLSNNNVNDATHIAKGKRTRRLRLLSNMTSSCSSASGGGGGGDDQGSFSISSTTTTTDQEEEDMANCLILLAQGGRDSHHHHHHQQRQQQQQQQQQENQKQQADDQDHDDHGDGNNKAEIKGRKISDMGATTTNNNKVGFYIYECKTCNRTFPSFQALGGHRASHKKPKLAMAVEEKKPPPPASLAPAASPSPSPPPPPSSQPQVMMNTSCDHHHRLEFEAGERKPHIKIVPPNPISLQLGSAQKANFNGNNKAKIHECSICGSEFTSGQALGGHMRRHRASTNASTQPMSGIEATCNAVAAVGAAGAAVEVQPRNILELDLNLPAPEEDLREPKFQFTAATQKSMVLSAAPALVDCHY